MHWRPTCKSWRHIAPTPSHTFYLKSYKSGKPYCPVVAAAATAEGPADLKMLEEYGEEQWEVCRSNARSTQPWSLPKLFKFDPPHLHPLAILLSLHPSHPCIFCSAFSS